MLKEQIESESRNTAKYFKESWPAYSEFNFDRTFSLRNWAAVLASIVLSCNKEEPIKEKATASQANKSNKIVNNEKNGNYEYELKKILMNKKILHIGCGYGYFLEVIQSLGAVPFGIEPYCSFPECMNIIRARVEDIQDSSSELSEKIKGIKFDIIVAHDLFLFSILFKKENAHKIIGSLKVHLSKNGIMVFENLNEEMLLEKSEIEKFGFEAEFIENILGPYLRICSMVIIRNKI